MTTTEENLRKFMLADSSIAATVGSRVSYNHVPQDKDGPYIFFQQTGAVDDAAMDDSAGVPTRAQYTFECWADRPADAISLKNLVHAKLNKHRGTVGDTTVRGIFAADVNDDYVPNGDGGDTGMHSAALTAEVVL